MRCFLGEKPHLTMRLPVYALSGTTATSPSVPAMSTLSFCSNNGRLSPKLERRRGRCGCGTKPNRQLSCIFTRIWRWTSRCRHDEVDPSPASRVTVRRGARGSLSEACRPENLESKSLWMTRYVSRMSHDWTYWDIFCPYAWHQDSAEISLGRARTRRLVGARFGVTRSWVRRHRWRRSMM